MLFKRHPLTPYQDRLLQGTVETTFLTGEMIYNRGRFLGASRGTLLRRGQQ
jgi:dihydroorotase-like cyclic amidohydrolase